jgi:hypothetical protein
MRVTQKKGAATGKTVDFEETKSQSFVKKQFAFWALPKTDAHLLFLADLNRGCV